MKRLGYLLSLAGHALLLLIVFHARFPITIRPEPPRVVVVSIAEPPLLFANGPTARSAAGGGQLIPAGGPVGGGRATGMAPGANTEPKSPRGILPLPAASGFNLRQSAPGDFRLAPVGKAPEPWAIPLDADAPRRSLRSLPGTYRPGATFGGGRGPGGVFLLPFDIREKAVADWVGSVMARIERNWNISLPARIAYSGWVRIGLIIEKSGRRLELAMEETTLPEALARSALDAVQSSLPLPALPENVAGETFAFTFVFTYNE